MAHEVISLRGVEIPEGGGWMRLEDAEAAGIDMNGYSQAIGPRRRGIVYYGAYWGDVNTVHDVFVKVAQTRCRGRFAGRRVIGWEVAEQCASDGMRVRRHVTPWNYERGNQPLFTIGE